VTSKPIDNVLARLDGVRRNSSGWQAKCPCRDDDDSPSLSVKEGDDGRVLVYCHAGRCNFDEICKHMGLEPAELMAESLPQPKAPGTGKKLRFVASYDYHDEDGVLLFQKVRYLKENGKKTFLQRKPAENGEWNYSLGDTPRVLYNLPAVLAAKSNGEEVWLVEGEKDADTLIALGLTATTTPNGAGGWLQIHTEALAGAKVEIIADNDEAGLSHAAFIEMELKRNGVEAQSWVTPREKDITDFLGSGGEFSDLVPLEHKVPAKNGEAEVSNEVGEDELPTETSKEEAAVERIKEILGKEELTTMQMLAKVSMALSSVTYGEISDPGRIVGWEEFVDEADDNLYEWIIPGFLEARERVIIVAAEGVGKTMLARQVAICSAAGINPFTYQPMEPIKTLTVDLENPEKIIKRMSRGIVNNARKFSKANGMPGRVNGEVLSRPSGLDLMKQSDRLYLENALERVQPRLLVMGPLYKAFVDPGGRTAEAVAVEVAKYLDNLRVTYGCALWLEHHAPLGSSVSTRELRPFGSAVWSRWPEFGMSLQPDPTAMTPYTYQIRHFRGARDQRYWPQIMRRGKLFPFEFEEFSKVDEEYVGVPTPRVRTY
jgi:5S rRNA maturation endonuclease (ribonuclease M5)